MKVKKFLCIFTMITMLIAMLPSMQAAAFDSTVSFKRVTSADELVVGAKYLIVGYDVDEAVYYALGDETGNESSGMRSPAELKENGDGTLSALDRYDVSVYPLVMELSKQYVTSENKYSLKTDTGGYLNAFYYYKKTYAFSDTKSKSLPIAGANGVSNWEPILREDGTVLFKTTKTINSVEQSSYIRFFHYQSGSMTNPAFSGGLIGDSNIDLPQDSSLTTESLTETNIPVKTYLYKEVCAHDAANLTFYEAKASTCSTHGNIEYYYCSNCCGYLDKNKTEIKLADTVLPLAAHAHTTIVPPKEATCTEHGNIAYTKCEDCGKYFEGSSTNTQIDINTIDIPSINHSYADGKCSVCGAEVVTSYFGYNNTGDGSKKIFTAEYNGKIYAMGMPNEKGMAAVEISEEITGVFKASNDTAAFATIEDGSSTTSSDGYTYTPKYIKIGQNYLKNDSGNLKFVCTKENATYWRYEYGYMNDDTDSQKYICLITNDGDPYFSVSNTIDENHIKAYVYYEKCHHEDGLIHSPEVAPTCYTNGMKEYWTCNVCDMYYSDSEGISEIWNKDDLIILALGAKDANGDDICDYCGKNMPIFTKVTNADEIVMQNKYILVAKYGESYYAMAPLISDSKDEKGGSSYSNLLPAVPITPLADGTFKYKEADDQNAFIFTTEFAAECSDLDNGEIRYSLQGTVDGKVSSLADQFGEFFMGDAYAKYGYRLGLNDDGTASIQSVYSKTWDNTDNGYMRFYYIDGQYGFSVLAKDMYKGNSIIEKEVYLYRMTENGTINGGLHTYTLNDAKSPVSQSIIVPSESAAAISNISGVSQALTKDAINGFVTKAADGENVRMNVVVGITASASTEADKETGTGASITYTISPKVNIATNSNPTGTAYDLPDTAFDGSPMKVMLYTAGTNPQQIVHIKQDGTKEYFYPEWSEEVTINGEKSFVQSRDKNGNMYVTLAVTEFSDIKLLDTPETPETYEFSISDYDEKMCTVVVCCAEAGEYALIFADYEGSALNDMKTEVLNFKAGENTVFLPKELTLSFGDKIFLWKDIKNIQPLCEAYTIK